MHKTWCYCSITYLGGGRTVLKMRYQTWQLTLNKLETQRFIMTILDGEVYG